MNLIIIGGGFNGQLLHTLLPEARVLDWHVAPPDPSKQSRQFGPQYLWQPVGTIPCRQFEVITKVDGNEPNEDSILAYKKKVGKEQDGGDWRAQFQPRMPGYEPTLPPSRVEYGKRIVSIERFRHTLTLASDGALEPYDVLVSTIPLYALLGLLGIREPAGKLRYRPIYIKAEENFLNDGNIHVNYISDPDTSIYRQTARHGQLHSESLEPLPGNHTFKYSPGKIYAHPGVEDLLRYLQRFNIFTFGRFARWQPDELAHETYETCRQWRDAGMCTWREPWI